jgi:site-specific recombinase XerD
MKISIILYKSKTLSDASHPLMVRISQLKARKYLSTGLSCMAQWWDFDKHAPKRNHPHRNLLEAILSKKKAAYHTRLLELESEQKTLSLQQLVEAIEEPKQVSGELLPFLKEVCENLTQNGKIGRSSLYKRLYTSLKEFTGNRQLCFSDIDVSFLNQYETFLYKQGLAENSISTYFKVLRALLNKAIQSKRMKKDHYPFDNFSLGKFSTLTQKRAMSKEDLKQIIDLPLDPNSKLQIARDMAVLKWKQIVKDRVGYKRLKTGKLMQFQLIAPAMEILERYKKLSGAPEEFVFPILDKAKHLSAQQISYRINNALKEINTSLKELAQAANVPVHLTTYVARHTYILMRLS